ncbi:FMN-binding negative transcriptional regulator [Brachymonas wangyanguii]|uniref:FMN-binding negative transcriptional regulator n=1 Tax=Brachymonas wangyanguii TaxID=3130163 RepID=UPI00307E1B96
MYLPEQFHETRPDVLQQLIAEFPFATLVNVGPDGLPVANHLPFYLDPDTGSLRAHMARANPLCQQLQDGQPVLLVFQGGDSYISPSWYPSKEEAHRQVPTWNYRVVHVRGRVQLREDQRFLLGVLARLTRQQEATQAKPWKMKDAEHDFLFDQLKEIVGIEVFVDSITGKFKLGQNKEDRDRLGAADGLETRGEHAMAQHMREAGRK